MTELLTHRGRVPEDRRGKVETLLEFMLDVELGLRDPLGTGEHIPLMCRAWNAPAYRRLRQLIAELGWADPVAKLHLSARYLAYTTRQVLRCPTCRRIESVSLPWKPIVAGDRRRRRPGIRVCHACPGKPRLREHVERVHPEWVEPAKVERGIVWLVEHFRCDPSLPEDVLAVLERRDPKRAAS